MMSRKLLDILIDRMDGNLGRIVILASIAFLACYVAFMIYSLLVNYP